MSCCCSWFALYVSIVVVFVCLLWLRVLCYRGRYPCLLFCLFRVVFVVHVRVVVCVVVTCCFVIVCLVVCVGLVCVASCVSVCVVLA